MLVKVTPQHPRDGPAQKVKELNRIKQTGRRNFLNQRNFSTFKRLTCTKSRRLKWWNFYIKKVPQHPRYRLIQKEKELNEAASEILLTKIIPAKKPLYPQERTKLKEQKTTAANSDALVSIFNLTPEKLQIKVWFLT